MTRSITLRRTQYMPDVTLGVLTVRGDKGIALFECLSMELPWRKNLQNTSCIPTGRYKIGLEYSPAFKMNLWELKGVPGRSEVKIHPANYVNQLRGCIAPGLSYADLNGDNTIDISNSRIALTRLMAAMAGVQVSRIDITEA